jgi:AcrR family transcriptional regulator
VPTPARSRETVPERVDPRAERSARREARRAELLDAARSAIRREGAAASMEVIAAEAGITKPILYKHFGDRSGLAEALAHDFVDGLMQELSRALGSDVDPEELLRTTIDTYLAFVEADPQIYRFLVQSALAGPAGVASALTGVIPEIGRRVVLVIGEGLGAAGLDTGPAEPWAFGIVGMVHLAGDWWVDRRTMSRARLVEYLTRLLWDGMARWGTPTRPDPPA